MVSVSQGMNVLRRTQEVYMNSLVMEEPVPVQFEACPAEVTEHALVFYEQPDIRQWNKVGLTCERIEKATPWWLADWLVYGEDHFGDDVFNDIPDADGSAMESALSHYSLITQDVYKKVARRFPPAIRKGELTFSHYREAAISQIDPAVVDNALDMAVTNKWSIRELRRHLSDKGKNSTRQTRVSANVAMSITIDVPKEQGEEVSRLLWEITRDGDYGTRGEALIAAVRFYHAHLTLEKQRSGNEQTAA